MSPSSGRHPSPKHIRLELLRNPFHGEPQPVTPCIPEAPDLIRPQVVDARLWREPVGNKPEVTQYAT
jgi:hypothetical protein